MTRKIRTITKTQDPVTVRVRCSDSYHRVTWRDHRLVLENHTDSAVKMMDLFDGSCRCMEILRAVRTVGRVRPTNVPPHLWKGVKFSMDTLHDRYAIPFIDRCIEARFFHTPIPTINFSTDPPQFTVWFGQALDTRLAIYRAQQWEVDWKAVREYSGSLLEFISGPTQRCRLCNYRTSPAGILPGKPNYVKHLRSPEHQQRIFAGIAAVFEVSLPDDI